MGIDIRTSRIGYNDRCKFYKGTYVDHMKLIPDAVAQGVFYSTDAEPMTVEILTTGNIRKKQYRLTIITEDIVSDLEPDYYVLYGGDDELWLVEHITPDDENNSKEFSKRPSNITKIRMRR